jgi:hypothetical protein
MRASHPSSPEYGAGDDEPDAGDGERGRDAERDGEPDDGDGENRGAAEGDSDGLPETEGARPRGYPGRRGLAPPGQAKPRQPGPLGGSEPYRPWFSSGELLEPWFTGDLPG